LQVTGANRSVSASVADEYIVTFTSDVHDAPGLAKKLAAESGGELHHQYSTVLKGFSARLSPQAVVALSNNPNVESIEQDQVVTAAGMMSNGVQTGIVWGLDRVDQRGAALDNTYNWTNDGSGVVVYIIDSGILIGHNDFGGRASYGIDVIGGGQADDCNGHGTHMAGSVGGAMYGVAKGVSLVAVRVLDCNGQGTVTDVAAGLDWVARNHAPLSIANLSFSAATSPTLNQAVANAMAAGVTVVASGGDGGVNGYDACSFSPASAPGALTAGAMRQISGVDYMANISTSGSCIDLFAPGYQVVSDWIGITNGNSWMLDGTSSAAAYSSGAAALYLAANPSASPASVVSGVIAASTTGILSGLVSGSPNRILYTGTSTQTPPPPPPPSGTNLPPTASFSASCSKATCSFDASASKDDAGVVRYEWSFGDGGTATLTSAKTSHVYAQKGSYSVTVNLTVFDAAGLSSSYRKTLNIRNNGK
jgi:subtilisin family serine protease